MINPDKNGLYHPKSENDIITLVRFAIKNSLQVRVRGAAQSVKEAVFTDGYDPSSSSSSKNINMELDQMRSVSYDDQTMQVTVGAGCNLGWDPFDPSGTSDKNDTNNLLFQLNKKGWALPNVPDVIHQTVGGFISTGSSGGSVNHSFDENIIAIRVIDGSGSTKNYSKSPDPDDPFFALGVSMGLLGIITAVTLQCVPAFNILGEELTTPTDEAPFDFFGSDSSGKMSLKDYLVNTEFTRLLWWPFPTLQRVITWRAHTMQSSDYQKIKQSPGAFKPKPYQPVFPKIFGSTLPSESVAGTGFRLIANWPDWLYNILGNSADTPQIKMLVDKIAPYLYPFMINMYFPCNSSKHPPQQFWDHWLGSLPMDKIEFSNNMFDLCYTELWISLNDANKAVNVLQNYYQSKGNSKVSYYTVEVLGTKSSKFWMSPAYNQDVIRLNIMRFGVKEQEELVYYQQFWDLMKQNNIAFRLHWGKFMPSGDGGEGVVFLKAQYPKWDNFLSLRSKMDPHNIFLTGYWKKHLGIT